MSEKESIPAKFMRPRDYARRIGVDWRTMYSYITRGIIPASKFQGVLLIDVLEADNIIKGLVHHIAQPIERPGKVGRPRKSESWQPIQRTPLAIGWQPEFY